PLPGIAYFERRRRTLSGNGPTRKRVTGRIICRGALRHRAAFQAYHALCATLTFHNLRQEGASMITRRRFVRDLSCLAAVGQLAGEAFLARRAWAGAAPRDNMVWLDANENPAGPPLSAIKAIVDGAGATARYHFDEFVAFAETIAHSESLSAEHVVFGI